MEHILRPRRAHSEAELGSHPPMLVNEISRLFFDRMRKSDPPGALSSHGCRLLLLALVEAKDPMTQKELADATHLKAPTVSAALRDMEEEGLILRTPDTADGRATRVSASPAGRAANTDIRARLQEVGDLMMQGFTQEEQDMLGSLLLRMRRNLLGGGDI